MIDDFMEDYYFNEQDLLVFTESYHLKRGYCCGNKCLHCPFAHENVPEDLNKNKMPPPINKNGDEKK